MSRARIPAAMLRELKDLRNPKKTSAGRYLFVPKMLSVSDWEAIAKPMQARLMAEIRD